MPPKKKQEQKKEQAAAPPAQDMDKFAQELAGDSDSDEAPYTSTVSSGEDQFDANGAVPMSEAERELLKEELKKTEDEIVTLRQVLTARQKHSAELKRKLGLTPLGELTSDINKTLKTVTDTEAYQKTTEVAAATGEAVKGKWNDMRNSSLFKSFESKLGTAYNSAKIAASTSIDQLSAAAGKGPSQASTPSTEANPPMQ